MAAFTRIFRSNIEHSIILDVGDYNDALQACRNLNPPAELASFASRAEYNFILDIIDNIEEPITLAWVGLERDQDSNLNDGDTGAKAFEFIDGTPNTVIEKPFAFPWAFNEPDNFSGNQFCAAIAIDFDGGQFQDLDDQSCTRTDLGNEAAVCKRFISDTVTRVSADGSFQLTVLKLPNNKSTFDDGIEACSELDPPGQLASFESSSEFSFIVETGQLVSSLQVLWVGLKRGPDRDGVSAEQFKFLDGTSNSFIEVGGDFPWVEGKPNNLLENQRCGCVSYTLPQSKPNLLEDLQCNAGGSIKPIGGICKQILVEPATEAPNKLATSQPTLSPITRLPTQSPTRNVTPSPTVDRNRSPSSSPSFDNVQIADERKILDSLLLISASLLALIFCLMVLLILKIRQRKRVLLSMSFGTIR